MFSSNTIYPSVHFPHISGDYNHVSRYKFNIVKLTGLNRRGKIFVLHTYVKHPSFNSFVRKVITEARLNRREPFSLGTLPSPEVIG